MRRTNPRQWSEKEKADLLARFHARRLGSVEVGVSVRFGLEELGAFTPAQVEALMMGLALILNANKEERPMEPVHAFMA